MSLGYRLFLVEGDAISPISQKTFQRFHMHGEPTLPQFAGRIIEVATVIYTLENRKPKEIVRIDCSRFKVKADGSNDRDYGWEARRACVNQVVERVLGPHDGDDAETSSVVDASARFARRWTPTLSGPAHKRILDFLFR